MINLHDPLKEQLCSLWHIPLRGEKQKVMQIIATLRLSWVINQLDLSIFIQHKNKQGQQSDRGLSHPLWPADGDHPSKPTGYFPLITRRQRRLWWWLRCFVDSCVRLPSPLSSPKAPCHTWGCLEKSPCLWSQISLLSHTELLLYSGRNVYFLFICFVFSFTSHFHTCLRWVVEFLWKKGWRGFNRMDFRHKRN